MVLLSRYNRALTLLFQVPSSAVVNPTQGVSLGAAGLLHWTNSVTSLLSLVAFGADPLCACQALGNSTFVCSDRHQLWMVGINGCF